MKILIIGLGSIAKKHIEILKNLNQSFIFYALRSKKDSVKHNGVLNIYSFSEIKIHNFYFAIISSPSFLHKEHLIKIVELNIQHYEPGGGFKIFHCENSTKDTINRHLVFMTYLNDVNDGGTIFKYQNLITPATKGSTLIWPVNWTHTHKGQISGTSEKYIITGWLERE